MVLDVTAADRAQAARLVAEAADGSPGAALWPAVRAFAADPEDEAARASLAAALAGGPDGDDLPGRHPLDGAAPFVVLADAAELLDDPALLHAYAAAMTGAVGVTLAIDATALHPDAAAERLGALVADAGVGDDLDLLAVTGALDEIGRARLVGGVRAILGDRPDAPGRPRFGAATRPRCATSPAPDAQAATAAARRCACSTHAVANARRTGWAREPSPDSSGWNSVPRKKGWSGQLERADVAERVVAGEPHAAHGEGVDVGGIEAVGAVVALDAALHAHDPLHQRAGGEDDPALVAGERALELDDDERAVRTVLGVRGGRDVAQVAGRASSTACWKPPQVPRNGMPCSRASGRRDRALGAAIRAAGDHPDAVEAVQGRRVLGVLGGHPVRLDDDPSRSAQGSRAAGRGRGPGRSGSGCRRGRWWRWSWRRWCPAAGEFTSNDRSWPAHQ